MRFEYDNFTAADLRGSTITEYFVDVEADLRVLGHDGRVLYAEHLFPVLELACELLAWWESGPGKGDFDLVSLSFQEHGALRFANSDGEWVFSSAFRPDQPGYGVETADLDLAITRFAERLRADLPSLGLDPALVAGESVR